MTIKCACGKDFNSPVWRIKSGRGKYCSRGCMYKYRTRPSGLNYNIVAENRAWFKKGVQNNPNGGFKKGVPHVHISKGTRVSPRTEFKKGHGLADDNINWAGDNVGYYALHAWVKRVLGSPKACDMCGKASGRIEWANKSHNYLRDTADYMPLCKKCHIKYDKENGWGDATKKYNLKNYKK